MGIIAWIVFGLAAGWLAARLTYKEKTAGCFTHIVVGITGALLGGSLYHIVTGKPWDFGFNPPSFLVAVGGAIGLLLVLDRLRRM